MRQLAAREDVTVDESAACGTGTCAGRIGGRDSVVEKKAVFLEQAEQLGEIERAVGAADMLVHADRYDLVEGLAVRDVAIILEPDLGAIRQARLAEAAASEFVLPFAERDPDGADAVMTHGIFDKPAPAATDV